MIFAALSLSAALLASPFALAADDKPASPPAPIGAALFAKSCASCHGVDAKGKPAMAKALKVEADALDLTGERASKAKDADLTDAIAKGRGKMPAYGKKMSETEIAAVLLHVRSLHGSSEKK